MPIKKAILLPDIHYPEHNRRALLLLEQFIEDERPDYLIYMGDQLDMGSISHWEKENLRWREGKRLTEDYEGFDQEILIPLELASGNKCKRVWITGNHEDWANQYIDKNPELEGFLEPEKYLRLEQRKYDIVPLNKAYKIGKLNFIHGFYCNQYHAAKTLNVFEKSVVYAHCHTPQGYMKVNPIDNEDFHSANSLPCLCTLNPHFLQSKPNAWVNGFGIAYFLPNGNFNLYTVIISNNRFIYNGKLYE